MIKMLCGIEEAGRGPVIGPMVMAGCIIKEEDELKLKELGVKDSKLLSPKQRKELFEKIINFVAEYKIKIISPKEIDDVLNDKILNLNLLEAQTSVEIINELKPNKVILDCPSNNIKAYNDYVKNLVKLDSVEIISEHKADVNYPVVSAASILAKVTRDNEIEKIKVKIGKNFGSGYPSDPLTKRFLEKNYDKYDWIFRKTWATYQNIIKKKSQKNLFDY